MRVSVKKMKEELLIVIRHSLFLLKVSENSALSGTRLSWRKVDLNCVGAVSAWRKVD
jgi:hypothetical protein